MADFRSVKTAMWREDDWFQELPVDGRLLFIYLFTNPSASVAGIYKLPLRTMIFESGISEARVVELLAQFAADGKVFYEQGVVWVRRMREHQLPGKISHQLITRLRRDIDGIPECGLKQVYLSAYSNGTGDIGYVYPSDTVSIPRATDTDTDTDTDTEKILTAYAVSTPAEQPAPEPAPKAKRTAAKPDTTPLLFDPVQDTILIEVLTAHYESIDRKPPAKFQNIAQRDGYRMAAAFLGPDKTRRAVTQCVVGQRYAIGDIVTSLLRWVDNEKRGGVRTAQPVEREPAYKRAIREFLRQEGMAPNGVT